MYEQNARKHLKYITRKMLGKMNADELLPSEEEERRNDMMLLEIQNMNHPQLTQFIELYLDNTQNCEVTLAIAHVSCKCSALMHQCQVVFHSEAILF